jgi:hypothetical protein
MTAGGAVDFIVANLAAIQVTPGATFGYVKSLTEPVLIPAPDLREMELEGLRGRGHNIRWQYPAPLRAPASALPSEPS